MFKKLLAVVLVLVITLSGCSEAEASSENVYRVASGEPGGLNTALISDLPSFDVALDIYSGIAEVNENGEMVLTGANSIDISDDELTITVNLKDDQKWVDSSGEVVGDVTSKDYLYAYEQVMAEGPMSYLFAPVVNYDTVITGEQDFSEMGISAPDDYTLVVNLSYPVPYFSSLFTWVTFFPQPYGAQEQYGEEYYNDMNTTWYNGPFYPTSFDKTYEITMNKNQNYYDAQNVDLDGVVYRILEDETSQRTSFEAGELDFITTSDPEIYDSEINGVSAQDYETAFSYYLSMNQDSNRVTSDYNLRSALFYGFDRNMVLEGVSGDIDKAINYFIPEGVTPFAYDGLEYRDYTDEYDSDYNPDKAQEFFDTYMSENNISSPSEISIEFVIDDSTKSKKVAEALQANYSQQFGITFNVTIVPSTQYRELRSSGDFDMTYSAWSPDYGDPSTYMALFLSDQIGAVNISRYSNSDYDELFNEYSTITDTDERFTKFAELEEFIIDEHVIIPFYQQNRPYFINSKYTTYFHMQAPMSNKYTVLN